MILAEMVEIEPPNRLLFGLLPLLVIGAAVGAVVGRRKVIAAADAAYRREFAAVPTYSGPGHGLVEVVFHVYSGLLIWTLQREFRFWAKPDDARHLLARLHKTNLTYGFFAYVGLVVPLLSFANYRIQLGRINRQAKQAG